MTKVLFLRHAQSEFNKLEIDTLKKYNLVKAEKKLISAIKLINEPHLLDARITEYGHLQCNLSRVKHKEIFNKVLDYIFKINFKIKYVICSPMRRALQTAQLCLSTKEMKDNGIKLIVRAETREILDSQCDFPFDIYNSMKNFEEFDFSNIKESLEKYKELFVADVLENEETADQLKNLAVEIKELDIEERKVKVLEFLKKKKLKNLAIEKNEHVYQRIQKFKQFLRNFIKENNVKDNELIVVAHSRLCKAVQATGVNPETDTFINYRVIQNCELFDHEI